jgi:hypothetical protein
MEEENIIEVITNGSFVSKKTIREVLNITSANHWYDEINLLCKIKEDFTEIYTPYKTRNRIPVSVARLILETIIIDQAGEDVIIRFVHQVKKKRVTEEKND